MNQESNPSIIIGTTDKNLSDLNRILKKRNISVSFESNPNQLIEKLNTSFFNVAVIDSDLCEPPFTELIKRIRSLSPKTELIAITDTLPYGSEKYESTVGKYVYGHVEKPVNKNYVITLTLKAIEKQMLTNNSEDKSGKKPEARTKAVGAAETQNDKFLLSSSVNSLNSAVTITDMKRKIIYINQAHVRTFGYKPEELMGKKSEILYPHDDPAGVSSKIYEALTMVGWEGERLALRRDGGAFPVYEKTSVIKDGSGRELGIVSVIDDITSSKRLQQALKESEERYRTFDETAKSAIIAVDEEGRIILFNPAAERIFGYKKEEALNREFSVLFPERYKDIYKTELKQGANRSYKLTESASELSGLHKNGEEFPIDISLSSCRVDGRSILTAIIFDITERKNLEEQVLQSAKLAAVGELISGVTHEVNNPLAVVIGYSEMLLSERDMNDESIEALRSIYNEAERAKKVIQNLLSFARKHSPEKEAIQVNDIIEKTLSLTDYELKKNKVEVKKYLDPELPDTVGDPNQLQQVFLNLIINSQQAMGEIKSPRQLVVKTEVMQKTGSDPPDSVIEVTFSDNGPGIPENIMKKIFDPFYTTKPKGKGTGLGLSVSFGIIKEHGGEIYARQNDDRGVTFFIELPV